MILWDSDSPVPQGQGPIYRWNGYGEDDVVRSLLAYVEKNAQRLRGKYLAWIHELGAAYFEGKTVREWLGLGDGSSYWEMTLLYEKSMFKSRESITDAVRIFALEEILLAEKHPSLRLVSASKPLHQVIEGMARRLGIKYEWQQLESSREVRGLRRLFAFSPLAALALVSLVRNVWLRWRLRGTAFPRWYGGDQAIFLCTYFDNVDARAAGDGRFHSHYWGSLHEHLTQTRCRPNWLHIFIPHQGIPSAAAARDNLQRFQAPPDGEAHAFVDGYLTFSGLTRVLLGWVRLCLLSFHLRHIGRGFGPRDSHFSLWPISRRDWLDSLRGPAAINNLLQLELFNRALENLPHQSRGFYVCENQPWELALVRAWRRHGHGQLTAVAHSAVRFWDLRYFADPREFLPANQHTKFKPDRVAVTGQAAAITLKESGFPPERLVETEALRYTHLNAAGELVSPPAPVPGLHVLVLGDYLRSSTWRMMQLLEDAARDLPADTCYTVKPHPNMPVRQEDFPGLRFEVSRVPLAELLASHNCAYSSNMTAAAVDTYLGGLATVVMLDDRELNFSALRGQAAVRFVSTGAELAQALQAGRPGGDEGLRKREGFFHLDPKLPRWSQLLKN